MAGAFVVWEEIRTDTKMWKLRDVGICCLSPVHILFHSLQIFLRNKLIFSSIFAFAAAPLAFLIFSLSMAINNLRSEIYHLEAVASLAPTRFEARHVWKESREDAASLLRTKALFSIPCYLISLTAAITSVHVTVLSYNGKIPTFNSAVTAVKQNWKGPSVTTILIYAILLAFAPLPHIFATLIVTPDSRFVVLAIGSVIEIYLMAALSMGLVVSIAEDRFGWDAIKVGSALMQGRRFCGWVLSGLFVLVSSVIRRKLDMLMNVRNSPSLSTELLSATTVMVGIQDKMGLIYLYGLAVLLSYVITAVFYCDSRRQHPISEEEDDHHKDCVSP